jgi:hypothetical protein
MRYFGSWLSRVPADVRTHQRRRLVVFFATFLAFLCVPTAFRPADDLVFLGGRPVIAGLTFLAVFFALVVNSAITSVMCVCGFPVCQFLFAI